MPKSKFYAVKKGRKPGIYRSWDECKSQTQKYGGAIFKSFPTLSEAQLFVNGKSGVGVGNKGGNKGGKGSSAGGMKNSRIANSSIRPMVNTAALVTAIKTHQNAAPGKQSSIIIDLTEDDNSSSARLTSESTSTNRHSTSDSARSSHSSLQIQMYFDGGSRGNPGIAGCGAYVVATTNDQDTNKSSKEIRHFCGNHCTNNIAEYSGLVEGLKQIHEFVTKFCDDNNIQSTSSQSQQSKSTIRTVGSIQVNIYGDSNLIINQMNGNYAVKNKGMKVKYQECIKIINEMKHKVQSSTNDLTFSISFQHVYRNNNKIADRLANEAMDLKKSWITTKNEDEVEV